MAERIEIRKEEGLEGWEPSPDWTPEERIKVAAEIARTVQRAVEEAKNEEAINLGFIDEAAKRIEQVLAAAAATLENHRDQILRGKLRPFS